MNSPPPHLPRGPPPPPARIHELRTGTTHSRTLKLLLVPEAGSNATHVALLVRKDERRAAAGAAGAAGPPDAGHVALVVLGRVEIDHMADRLEVEAASGHVRGDERRGATRAEPLERALALRLAHVAVHGDDVHAAPRELLREPVRPTLRAHEDERQPVLGTEQLDQ